MRNAMQYAYKHNNTPKLPQGGCPQPNFQHLFTEGVNYFSRHNVSFPKSAHICDAMPLGILSKPTTTCFKLIFICFPMVLAADFICKPVMFTLHQLSLNVLVLLASYVSLGHLMASAFYMKR